MISPPQAHIMQNGTGWYWEVVQGHQVIARGITDTHAQAVIEAAKVSPPDRETWQAA